MRIGLIDIDSALPNLALMKISNYYKTNGIKVKDSYDTQMTKF